MIYKYLIVIDTEIENRKDMLRIFSCFSTDTKITSQKQIDEISIKAIKRECQTQGIPFNSVIAYSSACKGVK